MDANKPPDITSFVIRFVHPPAPNVSSQDKFHGSVRHIQTNREINFTRWSEAVSFISSYVSLEGAEDTPVQNQP